jgi:hypothetical protein
MPPWGYALQGTLQGEQPAPAQGRERLPGLPPTRKEHNPLCQPPLST